MRKIYVASSWRNPIQPAIVATLNLTGFEVYDFRNPSEHAKERDQGFHWSDIDPGWEGWTPENFVTSLDHPLAVAGFASDFDALEWADTVVLIMPCGRSAHLELGWAVGAGKQTAILLDDGEPELMYSMVDHLATTVADLLGWLGVED